jgi:(1->4)-alpha-D-glucan 1-alpha-D-glucosylmutase
MPSRVPLATYRLQFNSNFTFRQAIPVLDYLRDIGISHVYASPILASRSGSGHGYDVTDPTNIGQDIGGEDGFAEFQAALEQRGMGLLLDIVPNHMAASSENRWWMDVLEFGPDSPFASYFDIDWKPPSRTLENKLLLPFLGRSFGDILNDGELRIDWRDGRFVLQYGEQVFPIAPGSYAQILSYQEGQANELRDSDSPAAQEWRGIRALAETLAISDSRGQAAGERRTKFDSMRERLRDLLGASREIAEFLGSALKGLNGSAGDPRSFSMLEQILSKQHYRLAFWQTASDAINYRRFFSITDLVGMRVEDPSVFNATHDLAVRIGLKPACSGLRIDHIDGLRDPLGYLKRLRDRLSAQDSGREAPYLVVEKILETNEWLPEEWPVEGTTGYDYLNVANRLLVDEHQTEAMEKVYAEWTGLRLNFDDVLYDKKKLVMRTLFAVEMRALGRLLGELARDDRYARELYPAELREALIEITACLPVYRTYIQALEIPDASRAVLDEAIRCARQRRPTLAPEYFDFVSDVLLLAAPEQVRPDQREARLAFVTRWQQFTGSIMAKGFEDTALYVYFPLASLNEVGGDPRLTARDASAFHSFISARREKWPDSMNATTTHDTKRSEDTRARIAVLSEMPERWAANLQAWSRMNQPYESQVDGVAVPDRSEEYLFYQTLIGVWPLDEGDWAATVTRVREYLIKATREAKVYTRWDRPNQAREAALQDFVTKALDRSRNPEFCSSFERFQDCTARYGMLNGLAQTLLKATCPGVPDCYQGSELWDLRLVDPDNRATIDFEARGARLDQLHKECESKCGRDREELLRSWRDGRVKMHVLTQALNARNEQPDLFLSGDYRPLETEGAHKDRVVAFARRNANRWMISVTPRCVASLHAPILGHGERHGFWKDTWLALPDGAPETWTNALADGGAASISAGEHRLSVGNAFQAFPLAMLLPTAGSRG